MKTNWQAAIPAEVMSLICNVVDNLNDMPISEEWAAKTADKMMTAFGLDAEPGVPTPKGCQRINCKVCGSD